MDGWIDGWMHGWINGWVDGWMRSRSSFLSMMYMGSEEIEFFLEGNRSSHTLPLQWYIYAHECPFLRHSLKIDLSELPEQSDPRS
jgi:hypothetical protein